MSIFTKKSKLIGNLRTLMNEGPTIIGMMSVTIEAGGSLDTAVRDVAKNGPITSSRLFKNVVFDADTRTTSDIKIGLTSVLLLLPAHLTAYRRAVHMVIAASESSDKVEKARMLKDASDVSLLGLKEAGESYSSSLNSPCMMVFGLGIMVPMILMSILPMLSMGGLFSSSPIGSTPVSAITLIVIPAVIVMVILSVKDNNPFMAELFEKIDMKYVMSLMFVVPLLIIVWILTEKIDLTIIISFAVAGALIVLIMFPEVRKEKIREKQEQLLKDSVFELGNKLISGENFEYALITSLGTRKECQTIADSMSREIALCRGDIYAAIRMSLSKISVSLADTFCDIYRCTQKDIRDAGRLAISIGRQLQDQEIVRKGIQNKLKSMVDMMIGTAAIFAPMVLGMSVAMLGPLSRVAENVDFENTTAILSVYLVELCILMSFLTAYLNGRAGFKEIIFRIGMMLPISMTVFFLCTSISL
ncbi:MAG: hypothetical protein PHG86_04350 [Candidatus Methanomethylophilaceae archaeon]|nr:hypothetical protein [Candidatus Methanomethylophilaceae archaeon]